MLFFPGWNTDAATVASWLPESFLARFRCGVLEWPGLGSAAGDALPDDLDAFLGRLLDALPSRPVPVVGFCLGGIAAWALARRHPARVRLSVLVESPLHFPAVLLPLLVPGLDRAVMYLGQGTRLGRRVVSRAILQRGVSYPQPFLDGLFAFDRAAAIHYLRLFRRYERTLEGTHTAHRPCWHLVARAPLRVMGPALGRRHRIQAERVDLDTGGHFPAVEAPGPLFGCLAKILDARPGADEQARGGARPTAPPSPAPSGRCACG